VYAGSIPDEVIFKIYVVLPDALGSLTQMSTRNVKIIMFLGSKVRRVRRADNLTAIYEQVV
jgi:hypothetical protein